MAPKPSARNGARYGNKEGPNDVQRTRGTRHPTVTPHMDLLRAFRMSTHKIVSSNVYARYKPSTYNHLYQRNMCYNLVFYGQPRTMTSAAPHPKSSHT